MQGRRAELAWRKTTMPKKKVKKSEKRWKSAKNR